MEKQFERGGAIRQVKKIKLQVSNNSIKIS